ncbi:MAG TPA: amidohydrolase family protein [Thermoanaerobaculia bacterium]|nr:amidohydrolase family protein [Thermoanaerobaculia bacterium]
MKVGRIAVLISLVIAAAARADAPGVFAITNGSVHPVSGPEIRNGVVIVRNGLIEAVGSNVAVPPDATVIDAAGGHVYPGLIDAHTELGFSRRTPSESRQPQERQPQERQPEPTAATVAAETISVTTADLDARRRTGVTTVVAVPSAGIFSGQSVVLNLSDGEPASRVIRTPAAVHASFATRPAWTFPDSLMGVIAHLRQTFLDAQHHAAARTAYDRNPAQPRPAVSPELDALLPVVRRELPIVMVADSEEMIRRAQAIAREFSLRLIVSGAREAFGMSAQELRGVPVLVSVDWPAAPTDQAEREEQPLRTIRRRVLAPTTPGVLAGNGVQFALVSGTTAAREFLPGIRKAIANGLTAGDALRAVTLTPARVFGVDRQLGSLERGKIANVVITDQPIFERAAKVTELLVDGLRVRVQAAEEEARDRSPVNGTWNLTVLAPQGNISIAVTLRAETGRVTGTYSGDRGSGEITGGFLDRRALQFTISAQLDAETHDWVFRGTITDDEIEGTVTTNLGSFEFSGSKEP